MQRQQRHISNIDRELIILMREFGCIAYLDKYASIYIYRNLSSPRTESRNFGVSIFKSAYGPSPDVVSEIGIQRT